VSLLTTVLAAAPSPTPSAPADDVDLVPDDPSSVGSWWDWALGLPLRILLIVVVGAVVLVVLRHIIRSTTRHIAEGTSFVQRGLRPLGESEIASSVLHVGPLASARRAQRARTIGSVLRSGATVVVGSIVVFLVLDTLGINLAPFIASAGIVGVALGFGAQSLVKDFLSGLFMLLEDQYGVGDVVDVGPATGTVEAVSLRVTKVRDGDGTLWYVPNGSMLRVGNKTQGWSNAVVEVDVDYFADVDRARAVLTEAAARAAADPVVGTYVQGEPSVTGVERLAADAVSLRLSVRTAPGMQWDVARALRTTVRALLDEAGIPLAGQGAALAAHRGEPVVPMTRVELVPPENAASATEGPASETAAPADEVPSDGTTIPDEADRPGEGSRRRR